MRPPNVAELAGTVVAAHDPGAGQAARRRELGDHGVSARVPGTVCAAVGREFHVPEAHGGGARRGHGRREGRGQHSTVDRPLTRNPRLEADSRLPRARRTRRPPPRRPRRRRPRSATRRPRCATIPEPNGSRRPCRTGHPSLPVVRHGGDGRGHDDGGAAYRESPALLHPVAGQRHGPGPSDLPGCAHADERDEDLAAADCLTGEVRGTPAGHPHRPAPVDVPAAVPRRLPEELARR